MGSTCLKFADWLGTAFQPWAGYFYVVAAVTLRPKFCTMCMHHTLFVPVTNRLHVDLVSLVHFAFDHNAKLLMLSEHVQLLLSTCAASTLINLWATHQLVFSLPGKPSPTLSS